eukprot:6715035-Prymnesium_polylepis.3
MCIRDRGRGGEREREKKKKLGSVQSAVTARTDCITCGVRTGFPRAQYSFVGPDATHVSRQVEWNWLESCMAS